MKQTKYPIFIISKGRWESRLTSKTLEEIGLDYKIVIEKSEYEQYSAVIDPKKILVLPEGFRDNPKWAIPDKSGRVGGGIPVRNWVWDYAREHKFERYWILDDNIRHFFRSHKNTRLRVYSSAPFRVIEDFVDRFENIDMAGMNYNFFVPVNVDRPAYILNTRIYSCILLKTDMNHTWKGRFNEDTNLSLDILKTGSCTFLLNAFSCGKAATHTMKGGNTEEIYKVGGQDFDNRREFAESLQEQHPDCVEIMSRWGRVHHLVNYDKFATNTPIPKPGIEVTKTPNEYGLKLVRIDENLNPVKILNLTGPEVIRESNFPDFPRSKNLVNEESNEQLDEEEDL